MSKSKRKLELDLLKKNYAEEFDFIGDLLVQANIPVASSSDSEDDDDEVTGPTRQSAELSEGSDSNTGCVATGRAQTLDELHRRIEALREEKYTYRGKVRKKGLQKKLKKKQKIMEMKTKRNERKKTEHSEMKVKPDPEADIKISKPIFNDAGNLVFSKFDLLGEQTSLTDKKLLKPDTNVKKTLQKIEKTEKYIKKLEDKGNVEKASKVVEENMWQNVLRKAEGLKVRDDPMLLKKAVNKKLAKKKVSKKKWDERLNYVEKQKHEKQKKRTENLNKRKEGKKKQKMKKAVKKGRYVPNV